MIIKTEGLKLKV